tara:strand:+ start:8867 stop:9280 length:414 start_codon:yes stop_codon:yes gene_type:complete
MLSVVGITKPTLTLFSDFIFSKTLAKSVSLVTKTTCSMVSSVNTSYSDSTAIFTSVCFYSSFHISTYSHSLGGLFGSSQLRTLADNQAVYISKHHQPAIVETVNFFNHSRYARFSRKQPAQCSGQSIKLDFDTKLRI